MNKIIEHVHNLGHELEFGPENRKVGIAKKLLKLRKQKCLSAVLKTNILCWIIYDAPEHYKKKAWSLIKKCIKRCRNPHTLVGWWQDLSIYSPHPYNSMAKAKVKSTMLKHFPKSVFK